MGGGLVNVPGGLGQLIHLPVRLDGIAGGPIHQLAGIAAAHSAVPDLSGNCRYVGHESVNGSGLFHCALSQRLSARGHSLRAGIHLTGHFRNITDDMHQIGVNGLQAREQCFEVAHIIGFVRRNIYSEVAVGHLT